MKNLKINDDILDDNFIPNVVSLHSGDLKPNFETFFRNQCATEASKYPFLSRQQIKERVTNIWKKKYGLYLNKTKTTNCRQKLSKRDRDCNCDISRPMLETKNRNFVPLNVDFIPNVKKGTLKKSGNINSDKRRVSFNKELYVRYRTTSEESSNSTLKNRKSYEITKNKADVVLHGSPSALNCVDSNRNYLKKNKKSDMEKKFDQLLNEKCSWSYRSQKLIKCNNLQANKNNSSVELHSTFMTVEIGNAYDKDLSDTISEISVINLENEKSLTDVTQMGKDDKNLKRKSFKSLKRKVYAPKKKIRNNKKTHRTKNRNSNRVQSHVSSKQLYSDRVLRKNLKPIDDITILSSSSEIDDFQVKYSVEGKENKSEYRDREEKMLSNVENVNEISVDVGKLPIIIQATPVKTPDENIYAIHTTKNFNNIKVNENKKNVSMETANKSDSIDSLSVKSNARNFMEDTLYQITKMNEEKMASTNARNNDIVENNLVQMHYVSENLTDNSVIENSTEFREECEIDSDSQIISEFLNGSLDVNVYQTEKNSIQNTKHVGLNSKNTIQKDKISTFNVDILEKNEKSLCESMKQIQQNKLFYSPYMETSIPEDQNITDENSKNSLTKNIREREKNQNFDYTVNINRGKKRKKINNRWGSNKRNKISQIKDTVVNCSTLEDRIRNQEQMIYSEKQIKENEPAIIMHSERHRRNSSLLASKKIKQIGILEEFENTNESDAQSAYEENSTSLSKNTIQNLKKIANKHLEIRSQTRDKIAGIDIVNMNKESKKKLGNLNKCDNTIKNRQKTWDDLENELLEKSSFTDKRNISKTMVLRQEKLVQKKDATDINLSTSNRSTTQMVSKSAKGNNMKYKIQNNKNKFFKPNVDSAMFSNTFMDSISKEMMPVDLKSLSILEKAVAAMEKCTRFAETQVCTENEKEMDYLNLEDFDILDANDELPINISEIMNFQETIQHTPNKLTQCKRISGKLNKGNNYDSCVQDYRFNNNSNISVQHKSVENIARIKQNQRNLSNVPFNRTHTPWDNLMKKFDLQEKGNRNLNCKNEGEYNMRIENSDKINLSSTGTEKIAEIDLIEDICVYNTFANIENTNSDTGEEVTSIKNCKFFDETNLLMDDKNEFKCLNTTDLLDNIDIKSKKIDDSTEIKEVLMEPNKECVESTTSLQKKIRTDISQINKSPMLKLKDTNNALHNEICLLNDCDEEFGNIKILDNLEHFNAEDILNMNDTKHEETNKDKRKDVNILAISPKKIEDEKVNLSKDNSIKLKLKAKKERNLEPKWMLSKSSTDTSSLEDFPNKRCKPHTTNNTSREEYIKYLKNVFQTEDLMFEKDRKEIKLIAENEDDVFSLSSDSETELQGSNLS